MIHFTLRFEKVETHAVIDLILISFVSFSENAKNSDIPQNYLLITNNEIVRPRYLLIYGTNKPTLKKSTSANLVNNSTESIDEPRTFFTWCRRNPLIVSAAIYLLLLFLVGLSSHRSFDHYKNILINFFKKRFKFE